MPAGESAARRVRVSERMCCLADATSGSHAMSSMKGGSTDARRLVLTALPVTF